MLFASIFFLAKKYTIYPISKLLGVEEKKNIYRDNISEL